MRNHFAAHNFYKNALTRIIERGAIPRLFHGYSTDYVREGAHAQVGRGVRCWAEVVSGRRSVPGGFEGGGTIPEMLLRE